MTVRTDEYAHLLKDLPPKDTLDGRSYNLVLLEVQPDDWLAGYANLGVGVGSIKAKGRTAREAVDRLTTQLPEAGLV